MTELHVLVGVPGCGKSTWAATQKNKVIVSRDEIRFSLLNADDSYFDKEKKVFKTYAETIKKELELGHSVIADATHIDSKSRAKLINAVGVIPNIELIFDVFTTPLQTCIIRNGLRTEIRKVPTKVIEDMFVRMELPTTEEVTTYKYPNWRIEYK